GCLKKHRAWAVDVAPLCARGLERERRANASGGVGNESGRLGFGRRGGAAAAYRRVRLREATVVNHQAALGADRKRPGRQDGPDAAEFFAAHATTEGNRHRLRSEVRSPRSEVRGHARKNEVAKSQVPLACGICEICEICGSAPVVSSPLPGSRTSGTGSPWRPAGSDGRQPAFGAPAAETPGGRPPRPSGACPETPRRPRGTSRST
ncbi:MAG: hypothetical protein H6Q85_1571, partial [candidate division NC10 bacterium]|nr:hypothetical protein [candidate division NC10 bacterium]